MKYAHNFIIVFCLFLLIVGCEEIVTVDLADSKSLMVIDAWINNKPETQTIKITTSRFFYDYNGIDSINATSVIVSDETDPSSADYVFLRVEDGIFQWVPATAQDSFGIVGHTYRLTVDIQGNRFEAISTLNKVPLIDSLIFTYEPKNLGFEGGFIAEFFATDLPGRGDTYWVKAFKNNQFLDKPEYIATSYDGGYTEGDSDSILFIPPIRSAINPFEESEKDKSLIGSPYAINDTVRVELHRISEDAFSFLNEILTQTNRPGGISELFSVPITNLTSNIKSTNSDIEVLGFFSTSSVSQAQTILTEELATKVKAEN
jgi:hypothetical protein